MAAKGFKELVLIPALTEQELTVREARAAIDAVFASIKEALLRHERVDLPIGNFTVVENPKEHARRSGEITELRKYRVEFAAPPSPLPKRQKKLTKIEPTEPTEPTKTEPTKSEPTKSEPTTAAQLIVEFIRENVAADSWIHFFNELSDGPSIRVAFRNVKPKPDERRPLDEAAQVIDECAPKVMPEDIQRRFDACLVWLARWTQRVMPNEVWQGAMQQAQQTLVPRNPTRTLDR